MIAARAVAYVIISSVGLHYYASFIIRAWLLWLKHKRLTHSQKHIQLHHTHTRTQTSPIARTYAYTHFVGNTCDLHSARFQHCIAALADNTADDDVVKKTVLKKTTAKLNLEYTFVNKQIEMFTLTGDRWLDSITSWTKFSLVLSSQRHIQIGFNKQKIHTHTHTLQISVNWIQSNRQDMHAHTIDCLSL